MVAFFTLLESTATGVKLINESKNIKSKIQMVLKWVRNGSIRVVILGCGGAGKTTLGKYLSDNDEYKNPEYIESAKDEEFNISENIIGKYWVAPGQDRRVDYYWPKIFRAITGGKVKLIINVVSYGFNSVEKISDYKDMKNYYKDDMSKEEFLSSYLEQMRNEEIRLINEIKPRLNDTEGEIKMITLVTKQDLWWKDRNEVQTHYTLGIYNDAIKEIEKHKGLANFSHSYISVSLLANNFNIGKEPFKLVSEGYDENIRISNLNTFIKQLQAYL